MKTIGNSNIRRAVRGLAGIFGALIGWIAWSVLWDNFVTEVSELTLESVRSSTSFGMICGLLGAFLVVGLGLFLSYLADQIVIYFQKKQSGNESSLPVSGKL